MGRAREVLLTQLVAFEPASRYRMSRTIVRHQTCSSAKAYWMVGKMLRVEKESDGHTMRLRLSGEFNPLILMTFGSKWTITAFS